jgi:hypothetical protein
MRGVFFVILLFFSATRSSGQWSRYTTYIKGGYETALLIHDSLYTLYFKSSGGDAVYTETLSDGAVRFRKKRIQLTDYNGGSFSFIRIDSNRVKCVSGPRFLKNNELVYDMRYTDEAELAKYMYVKAADTSPIDSSVFNEVMARLQPHIDHYLDTTNKRFFGIYCGGLIPVEPCSDYILASAKRYKWYMHNQLVSEGTWKQIGDRILLKDKDFKCVFELKKKNNILTIVKLLQVKGYYTGIKR